MDPSLEKTLKEASAADTCWPGCAAEWSRKNPAWGHCVMYMYMLYVNEFVGGEILFTEAVLPGGLVVPHYLNLIEGKELDLSASQFVKRTEFRAKKVVERGEVLSLPDGEADRYKVFRERVRQLISK